MTTVFGSVLFKDYVPEILDSYVKARVALYVHNTLSQATPDLIIRLLCKLSRNMNVLSLREFPRLMFAVPDKMRRGYCIACLYYKKPEAILLHLVQMTDYRCKKAFAQALKWFMDLKKTIMQGKICAQSAEHITCIFT